MQNKVYESFNKRLVSLISKEQEAETEPLMLLRNVALNLELNVYVSLFSVPHRLMIRDLGNI